jgi:hypothetical protein
MFAVNFQCEDTYCLSYCFSKLPRIVFLMTSCPELNLDSFIFACNVYYRQFLSWLRYTYYFYLTNDTQLSVQWLIGAFFCQNLIPAFLHMGLEFYMLFYSDIQRTIMHDSHLRIRRPNKR